MILRAFFCGLLIFLPGAVAAEKRLNNFVVELLNVSGRKARAFQTFVFNQPHDGWIYLSASARPRSGDRLLLSFDNDTNADRGLSLTSSRPHGERQSYLAKGEHTLRVHSAGGASLEKLIVRRVPETAFSKFGATPRVLAAGDHDWPFLAQHLLPHINTIISYNAPGFLPYMRQWRDRGGRWICETPKPASPTNIFATFGMQSAHSDGIVIDELFTHDPALTNWSAAFPPDASDKEVRFYLAGRPVEDESFFKAAIQAGSKLVWEKYLGELPPEDDEQAQLRRDLGAWMADLRKRIPGILDQSVICLGFFSAPPLSLNRSAPIDFKVWMDLQFQFLATDPAFDGLRAIMEYISRYADEETMRWAGLLFRHYCLEGQTNLLSTSYGFSYRLSHLRNGDFRDGLKHCKIEGAGSATHQRIDKLALWYGQFPYSANWDHAALINTTNGAVTFSQDINALRRGQWYSAKIITIRNADLQTGHSEPIDHNLTVRISNATTIPERTFSTTVSSPASGKREPFTGEAPLWMNYRQIVFRADAAKAALTIEFPRGAPDCLLPFVEVQPYLRP